MINKLIENYVNTMTLDDIDKFAKTNGVTLTNKELDILLKTIKKDWHTILHGNYQSVFEKVKPNLQPNTYQKAEELFLFFKNKYQRFLH